MRRAIVLALSLNLIVGAAGPATAKGSQRSEPAPVTFEASGAFAIAVVDAWIIWGQTGITRNDFVLNCAIPTTQGFDGFVVELPQEMRELRAEVRLSGSDIASIENLSMTFYDARCNAIGLTGERGIFDEGTKYILVSDGLGAGFSFDLRAVEIRHA